MKLIKALIAATVLVSTTLPLAAQTKINPPHSKITRKRRPIKPRRKAVAPESSKLVTTTPSGLTYIITRRGEGRQPLPGDTVIVHYSGLLTNGIMFDSSLNRGQPFVFELGTGAVIKGWDEGIGKLHVGDQATFFIPSQLGYGEKGRGPIPPRATLIFVIELVGIQEKPAGN